MFYPRPGAHAINSEKEDIMRINMTSYNIVIFTAVFVLFLVATFYQKDQIMQKLRTREKDNHKAVMDTFRQKGKTNRIFVCLKIKSGH